MFLAVIVVLGVKRVMLLLVVIVVVELAWLTNVKIAITVNDGGV